MSALPPKVDKQHIARFVRLVPKPDSCTAAKKHRYSITAGRIARCPSAALRVLCANKSTGCWQLNNKASRAQVQLSQYRFWSRRQTAYLRKMPLPSRQQRDLHLQVVLANG